MSPAARFLLFLLVCLGLGLWSFPGHAVARGDKVTAPVVQAQGANGMRKQIGTFTYKYTGEFVVLYCVPEEATTLACVVFVTSDDGNAVIVVDGLAATELGT